MQELIKQCIANFGPAPRKFSFWDQWTYLRIGKPMWLLMDSDDEMTTLFFHMKELYRNGRIVWGHVVQANYQIFEDGKNNVPGDIVYSLANATRATPEYLGQVADMLFSLKGTKPTDNRLAPIANYLTDELIRVYGLHVPPSISPSIRCQISTTFFPRKHLPNRKLCSAFLPIIVNPQRPYVVMPLPEKYWPERLVQWWIAG